MRKRIIGQDQSTNRHEPAVEWLDLSQLAEVEITSEDVHHPIEFALSVDNESGWKAEIPGEQTIRLLFDHPLSVSRLHLLFKDDEHARTQEFVLRWAQSHDGPTQEIVRQQFNFSPTGQTRELESYNVDLDSLMMLELTIKPDISGTSVRASLEQLYLA